MHPLCISQSVLKTIDNNKNTFKFILNGLENGAITKSKQKEISSYFTNLIFILILQEGIRFVLTELKKSKKILIDLDDTVYSVYLAQINFYAWLINRNLHSYILEEIINNEKIIYTPKKQKK